MTRSGDLAAGSERPPSQLSNRLPTIGRAAGDHVADGGGRGSRRLIRRYARYIALITVGVAASAALMTGLGSAAYVATAQVVVQPRVFPSGAAPLPANMGTEKEIAESRVVAALASDRLHVPVADLSKGLTVSVPVDTDVLKFGYAAADPSEAARRAEGLAESYVSYRNDPSFRSGPAAATDPSQKRAGQSGVERADLITPAAPPSAPVGKNYAINVTIGLALGLAVGIGSAAVRDRLDDRIRGRSDLEERTGLPVLAVIPASSRAAQEGRHRVLVMERDPASAPAEAYRYLRAKTAQVAADHGAKTIAVTSAIEQEGKDAATANLAAALATSGHRVVLVFGDVRSPHGTELFGVDASVGLTDVLAGDVPLATAVRGTAIIGLRILPPGQFGRSDASDLLHGPTLRTTLSTLQQSADYVLLSCPSVLTTADSITLLEAADLVLLVADTRRSLRTDIDSTMLETRAMDSKLGGYVLFDAPHDRQAGVEPSRAGRFRREVLARISGGRNNRIRQSVPSASNDS